MSENKFPEFEDKEITDIARVFLEKGRVAGFSEMQELFANWVEKRNIDDLEKSILELSDWLIRQKWEIEGAWLLGRLLLLLMSHGNMQGAKLIVPKLEEFKSFSPTAQMALKLYEVRQSRSDALFSPYTIERRSVFGFSVQKEPAPITFFENIDDVKSWIKKTFPPGIYDLSLLEEKSNILQHLEVENAETKNYVVIEQKYEGHVK